MNIKTFTLAATMATTLTLASASFAAPTQTQTANQAEQNDFTPTQVKSIESIVKNYLVKNPQILVEVSQALQMQQMQAAEKAASQAVSQNKDELFKNPNTPFAGNPNGSIYVVEFFDYQCGHCKRMSNVIQNIVKNNPNVKVMFKELPIFGGDSRYAAKAALAAAKQGKYYAFHDALLNAKNPLTKEAILATAKNVGIDVDQLKQDMATESVEQQLRQNFQLAKKLKLMGTPAFVIGNKAETKFRFIPGATTEQNLQQQINDISGNS